MEVHPPFQPLLDRTFRPDSTGVPKWKQRIREELSHRSCEWRVRCTRAAQQPCSRRHGLADPYRFSPCGC